MTKLRARGEPTAYEAALQRRLGRRAKAPPTTAGKPSTRATAATASAERSAAPKASRFAHLNAAIPAPEPMEARAVSPDTRRAEKTAADRRDHADLHRFGRVRSQAEREAEDARADRFARRAVALAEGRR